MSDAKNRVDATEFRVIKVPRGLSGQEIALHTIFAGLDCVVQNFRFKRFRHAVVIIAKEVESEPT